MKQVFLMISLFLGLCLINGEAKAQIPDSVRYRAQQAQYQMLLRVDAVKARKVAEIQMGYQDNVARILERLKLEPAEKHRLMVALDSTRVVKLKLLLDPSQLSRLKVR